MSHNNGVQKRDEKIEAIRRREAYLRISYGLASVQNILDLRSDLLFIIF